MADVFYRLAQPEDIDEIVRLEERCFPTEPWSRQMFSEELENDLALFVVAEDTGFGGKIGEGHGRIAGYLIAWVIAPVECQVGSIAVLPEYRRQGIARQLLGILLQTCRETGTPDAYLEVRVSNTAAIELYQSLGFAQDGLRKAYYQDGEDAITMARHEEPRPEGTE